MQGEKHTNYNRNDTEMLSGSGCFNKYFLSVPSIWCFDFAEEQHRLPSGQAVMNTVVVRLGGLTVLMLTVGRWADVLHILICFLGEASCLLPTMDLLDAASAQVSPVSLKATEVKKRSLSICEFTTGAEY